MDPNALLAAMRKAVTLLENSEDALTAEFAQSFKDLDDWLGKGGFLPEAWNKQTTIWTLSEEDGDKLYNALGSARGIRIGVDWGTLKWDGGNGWTIGLDPDQPAQRPVAKLAKES